MSIHKFEIGFSGNSAKKNGFDDPAVSFFYRFLVEKSSNMYMPKKWHKQKEKKF